MAPDVCADIDHRIPRSEKPLQKAYFGFTPFPITVKRPANKPVVTIEHKYAVFAALDGDESVFNEVSGDQLSVPQIYLPNADRQCPFGPDCDLPLILYPFLWGSRRVS